MRLKLVKKIIASCFLLLGMGLWYTQIIKGPFYYQRAERNRTRVILIRAPRGRILDRNGLILVEDRPSFDVIAIPQELNQTKATFATLSRILRVKEDMLRHSFKRGHGAAFAPVTVFEGINKKAAIILEERKSELSGIEVSLRPLRDYRYGRIASHILGYLGQINASELMKLKNYGYDTKDLIGRSGIEGYYDSFLRGRDGARLVEVDNRGRMKRILGFREPEKGKDLDLTIDLRIQKMVEDSLVGKRGAIIIMNPYTGEVLALASAPSFNPNSFLQKDKTVESMLKSEGGTLFNRAISGQYPLGSVFKIVVATAGLEEGTISHQTRFYCDGTYPVGNREFLCWKIGGHGWQDVRWALTHSCNIFFYQLGLKLGIDKISQYAHLFGLNEPTGIELWGEAGGLIPSKRDRRLGGNSNWHKGDTANLSIGQGYLLVTPIQAARLVSAIANGGSLIRPHLVKSGTLAPKSKRDFKDIPISSETISTLKRSLRMVVEEESGTGHSARIENFSFGGKTGTAQVSGRRPHAWFVGFAPFKRPKISFAVLLEHGGRGEAAGRLAKEMLEKMIEEGIL